VVAGACAAGRFRGTHLGWVFIHLLYLLFSGSSLSHTSSGLASNKKKEKRKPKGREKTGKPNERVLELLFGRPSFLSWKAWKQYLIAY
jgi:hypothetical protein